MTTITCCKCKKSIGKIKAYGSAGALVKAHASECEPKN